jgi:dTDP-glucose 4,6-dehydratase
MKRVLVTGGAGFIGSNFVIKSLKERTDLEITVLDALTYAGNLENLKPVESRIKFVHGDIRDKNLVEKLIPGQDLIVHFAAESHNDNSLLNPSIFIESNVVGTTNLLQAASKNSVRFHHISTDEVYGDLALGSGEKFTEESPYKPSSPYSASKAASDLLVLAWVRSFGLRATISNCSNNYGPNQNWEKFIPNSIKHLVLGKKPPLYGNGRNVRDWIHVDDHTAGVWAVIEKGQIGETYLLGANNERSNIEVLEAILREFEMEEAYFEFVEDRKGHDLRYAINASKVMSELGWNPVHTNFETNIKELVKIYSPLVTK